MAQDISDEVLESIAQLTYNNFKQQREDQRLDVSEIEDFKQRHIKPLYPHIVDDNGNKRLYRCCQGFEQSPGTFCCCTSKTPDPSFTRFGLAICLYMKFLKHANCVYLFLTILAASSVVVCIAVSVQNGFDPLLDYQSFFYSASFGAFSSKSNKCQYALISAANTASLTMNCPYGKINGSVTTTYLPATLSFQSQNNLFNCRNQRKSVQSGSNLVNNFLLNTTNVTYSNNNSTADITISLNGLQSEPLVAFVFECYDNTYNIGSISSTSDNLFYYIVGVDLAIMIIFMIFFCSQVSAQKDQKKFFKINQVALNDFAIQVDGMKRNSLQKQYNSLFTHLIQQIGIQFKRSLVAITIPQVVQQVQHRHNRRQIYNKFYNLMQKYYFRQSDHLLQFKDCHQIIKKDLTTEEYDQFKRKLKKYVQQLFQMRRHQVVKSSTGEIESYMVFDNVVMREKVMSAQKRYCLSEKVVVQTQGKNHDYYFSQPPVPDSMNWENRYRWTKFRSFLSWLLVITICVCCYLFFGWLNFRQSQLDSQYNYKIDCNVLFPNQNLATYNVTLSTDNNYLTCYCQDKSLTNVVSSQQNYCNQWQKQYITYQAIPLVISLTIVLVNVIVGQIFRVLSAFQRQKNAQNEQMSYAFKRGFLLMMNMGLVMILLNINYNNSTQLQEVSFIFLGKYTDFTSDWYDNIGGIIVLTMVFNIAFSLIELAFACVVSCLKKCWDTRCCTLTTSRTTKEDFISLYNDEIYPIGQRYAYLMATFFISMAFSGVIPILIPVTLISFLLLYYADKFLLFKYYQTPIQYSHSLHKAFLYVLYVSMIVHFGMTAFLLSEPTLIATGAYFGQVYSSVSSGNNRLDNMLRTSYILVYVIFFLLLIIYAFFRKFIAGLYKICCGKCQSRQTNYKSTMIQQMKLFSILSSKQRTDLKLSLEVNMRTVELKKRERHKMQVQFQTNQPLRIRQSQRPYLDFLMEDQIVIKNSLDHLRAIDGSSPRETRGQKLLGLPSYEECVRSNSVKVDDQRMRFQRKLRSILYSNIEPPTQHAIPSTEKQMVNKSDTALNREDDEI